MFMRYRSGTRKLNFQATDARTFLQQTTISGAVATDDTEVLIVLVCELQI